MDDLIRRQAAIDAIMQKPAWHGSDGSYYHSSDIRQALESLPPAQQWTPVSERLPEVYMQCLVCYSDQNPIGELWLDDTLESKEIIRKYNIIAWMPAPPKYEGE